MNDRYNQPTAHRLEPVKGWDSMAHLDFVAPIKELTKEQQFAGVNPYAAGTVMHLNTAGQLEPGLLPQSVGMFLFYKQNDEDTLNYPTTLDGIKLTSISLNSFGGYNSELGIRGVSADGQWRDIRNGGASNLQSWSEATRDPNTGAMSYEAAKSVSAHTTYPSLCGMELSSTEFAQCDGNGARLNDANLYAPNSFLTSPCATMDETGERPIPTYDSSAMGTPQQQMTGGFLKPGTPYLDPICGIVSKRPSINVHGYNMIYFWAVWLPALSTGARPSEDAGLNYVAADDNLAWA